MLAPVPVLIWGGSPDYANIANSAVSEATRQQWSTARHTEAYVDAYGHAENTGAVVEVASVFVGGGQAKAADVAQDGAQAAVRHADEAVGAAKRLISKPNSAAKGGGRRQLALPERAGPTAHIHPSEVAGKTPAQIDVRAQQLGLEPRGPSPAQGRGAYIDPQTGTQRVLSHPNASPPHGHVNNPAGQRLDADGRVVPPESPEAHLPIRVP